MNKYLRSTVFTEMFDFFAYKEKILKNILLLKCRVMGIYILSKSSDNDETIQNNLLNCKYKVKKRFLQTLWHIYNFYTDFNERDRKITEVL